ncbi:MAG: helix-turn-helix domain-containing protein [Haloarculaceae archaeon]
MSGGIRATVAFSDPSICQIAQIATETDSVVDSVSTSVATGDASAPVTEFSVALDDDSAAGEGVASLEDGAVEPVISYGDTRVFRYTHGESVDCPCECLGQFGCPVDRYFARDGQLTLVFHAATFEELQTVVGDLRDRYPDVDIRRLVRSPDSERSADTVFVDRGKLTDRQLEVLQTAYRMGYFERPRRANATDIAEWLDISPSTLAEHLASAQTKVVGDVLEEGEQ